MKPLSKRIQNRMDIIDFKREFGVAEFNFFTYRGRFSHSCYLSRENYLDKFYSIVDNPEVILNLLTTNGVKFNFEGRWYNNIEELHEEVLLLKIAKIL